MLVVRPSSPLINGQLTSNGVAHMMAKKATYDFPMARHTVGTLMAPVLPGAREDPREMTAIHVFHEFKGEIGSGEV